MGSPGTFVRVVGLLLVLASGCARTFVSTPPAARPGESVDDVVYLIGDGGAPNEALDRITRALAADLAADESRGRARQGPILMGLGDNLYEEGFPRAADRPAPEVARLEQIAGLLARARYEAAAVPVVFLPGNHDYDGEVLARDRAAGDITHWYFLDGLEIDGVEAWQMLPGRVPDDVASAAELYDRLYASAAEQLVGFMTPRLVPGTGASLAVVAIDSNLLIELYRDGYDDLAAEYLVALESRLAARSEVPWRVVAAHHPIETYGKHRPASPGRFLFGPGYPQFPTWWEKLLAIPPLGTIGTTIKWARQSPQDVHTAPHRRYSAALYDVLDRTGTRLLVAAHDHNNQLIDLTVARGGDERDAAVVQLVTGSASKRDPVVSGPGTLAYLGDHGYARLAASLDRLLVDVKDADGAIVFSYTLTRFP